MNWKALFTGLLVGFVMAISPACSGDDNGNDDNGDEKCDATTCQGCCDGDTCVASPSALKCGTGGGACTACGATQTCDQGQCKNSTGCNTCIANGQCHPTGASNANCGTAGAACANCQSSSQICDQATKACVANDGGGGGGGNIGDTCTSASDCGNSGKTGRPAICKTSTSYGNMQYPGGFCTRRCLGSSDCGTGMTCLLGFGDFGEADNICVPECPQNGQCRTPGYACLNFGSQATPAPRCWLNGDGGSFGFVDAGPPANANVMGGPCTANTACQPPDTGGCIPGTLPDGGPSGFTGGYCSAGCDYDPSGLCGTGGTCVLFVLGNSQAQGPIVGGLCQGACITDGGMDCRSNYYCEQLQDKNGYCEVRCDAPGGGCPQGQTCNTTTGTCS